MPDLPAVAVESVAHRFGRRWALRGVSFIHARGEILAIAGSNGSGKSTLLRIIATAIRATQGRGTVLGADLVRDAQRVRAMVALLSTDAGIYGDLTAFENLRFAARMLGVPDDALALQRVLDRVGLGRETHEHARHMSSGMQRRLSIGRLLLRRPGLLLLDEPYNSLDADGVHLVNELMVETRARGGGVILVAHDLARSEGLADRVLSLRDGLVCEPATVEEAPRPPVMRVERGGLR